jgi:hypothetical protein
MYKSDYLPWEDFRLQIWLYKPYEPDMKLTNI